jgi:hypothetical protein
MNNNLSDRSNQSSKESKETDNQKSTSQTREKDSFVKLAMRNMVKKGGTSLFHFFLTILGVFGTLVGLAIVFH